MNFLKFCAFGAGLACLMAPFSPAKAEHLQFTVYPLWYMGDSLTVAGYGQVQSVVRKTPGNISVVPAEEFRNTHAVTMKDMLATTPGVVAQPRYGEEIRLSIRGSGLSRGFHLRGITVLQDGVPINLADGSGDFLEIDPLLAKYIEVYRGGNALRYGVATLGGAINVVAPTALSQPGTVLRAEVGSFGTMRLHAATGQVFGDSDVFAAVTRSKATGFRQQSDSDNLRMSGNIGHKFNDNVETRFYMTRNDLEQEVPGTISRFDALHNPKSVPLVNITGDQARDIRSTRISNKTAFKLDNGMTATIGAYINDKELYHPIFQVIDQDSLDIGGFIRLENEKTRLGLNMSTGKIDAKRFVNVAGHRGALTADSDQSSDNYEIYGEHRFDLMEHVGLIGGAQAFFSRRAYEDRLVPAASDEKNYRAINPKVGLIYDPSPAFQVFGNISRSAEPPTFSELNQAPVVGFVPLNEQKAITAEIGTRMQTSRFAIDATIYRSWVKDELLQFTAGAGIPASTYNADQTIHQGLELGAAYAVTDKIQTNLVYTINDFFFDDDAQYGDNTLAGAATHQVRVAARYTDPSGWHVEPNVEWVPVGAFVDYANTLRADDYTVVNMNAGIKLGGGVEVFVDGRNLLDRKYIATFSTITDARVVGTSVFYPGEGRSVFVGVSVKF